MNTSMHSSKTGARGYTLIEAMVVVALLGILLAVAVPSFVSLMQRNRAAGEINSLIGDLQFARSEAIKRGLPVSLCTSSNGSTCLGTPNWHSGWIVFVDPDRSGTVGSAEALLRVRPAWNNGDSLVAQSDMKAVTFGRDGFVTSLMIRSGFDSFLFDLIGSKDPADRHVFDERVALSRFVTDLYLDAHPEDRPRTMGR